MSARGRSSLLLVALAVLGIASAFRFQGAIQRKLFQHRLEQPDLPPDDATKAARALRALGGEDPLEKLSPPARLRYLLANGYALRELLPAGFAGATDPAADATILQDLQRREGELLRTVMELTAANEAIPIRWLDSSDAEIRRRAAQCLGRAGSKQALPPLEARLSDPDPAVRIAAFEGGKLVLARAGERALRTSFLVAATRVPSLIHRAMDAADVARDPGAIPVLLAYLEQTAAPEADRKAAADAIRRLAGPERAASAPDGLDAAAWKAWWDKAGR